MSRKTIAYLLACLTLIGNGTLYGCGSGQTTTTTVPSSSSTILNELPSNEAEKETVAVEPEVFDWSETNVEKMEPLFELTEEKVEELTNELHAQIQSVYPGEYPRQNVEGFIYQLNYYNYNFVKQNELLERCETAIDQRYEEFVLVCDVILFINSNRQLDATYIDVSNYTSSPKTKKMIEQANTYFKEYLKNELSNNEAASFLYDIYYSLTDRPKFLLNKIGESQIDVSGVYYVSYMLSNIGVLDVMLKSENQGISDYEMIKQYSNYLGNIYKTAVVESNTKYLLGSTKETYLRERVYYDARNFESVIQESIIRQDRVYCPVTKIKQPLGSNVNKEEDCIDAYREFNNQFNVFVASEQDYMNYTAAMLSAYGEPKETGAYIQELGTEAIMQSVDAVLLDMHNELYYFGSNPTGLCLIPDATEGKLAFDKYKSLFQWAFAQPRAALPFSLENDANINPLLYLEWLKRIETMHNMESLAYRPMLTPEQLAQLEGLIETTKRDIASQLESRASNLTAA